MKYLSILRYVLLGVSALIVIVFFAQGESDSGVDTMLNWAYALMGLAAVFAIILPVFNLAKNPKSSIRSLIGLVVVAVVIAIAYSFSDSTPITTATKTFDNVTELRFSDTGLLATYAAFGLAILSIVVGEVVKLFK